MGETHLAACQRSRQVAEAHALDEQFPWHRGQVTLRFVYAHLIAELARHAGPGDVSGCGRRHAWAARHPGRGLVRPGATLD